MIPFSAIDQLRKLANNLHEKGETHDASTLAVAISDVVEATGKSDFYAATPYGVCPFCGDYEELLRIGEKSYAFCHEHRVFWYIGTILYAVNSDSCMTDRQNLNLLDTYTQIEISEVFPTQACPCCGLVRKHTSWCILLIAEMEGVAL